MVGIRSGAAGALIVVALVGCVPKPVPAPAPDPPLPTSSGATSASPTPSQMQLTKQVQAAYQVAFDEFERLSREGGADQPSARMLEVAEGLYLDQDLALLRDQKQRGYRVEGKAASTRSRSAVGASKSGSDERLTIQICEDRRGAYGVWPDGQRIDSRLVQGFVYAKLQGAGVKLVDVDTKVVQQCDW